MNKTPFQTEKPMEPYPPRLLDTPPFHFSRMHAQRQGCDLAVPSRIGLGSLVCYTPLVSALSRQKGKRIRLLTGRFPSDRYAKLLGRAEGESFNPIWEHNPYIDEIVNADAIDPDIMEAVSAEMDNFCQAGHVIENICRAYDLTPRRLTGELFLTADEQAWALDTLAHLRRPLVCLCPYGRSSSRPDSPWHLDNWERLLEKLEDRAGFFQVGNERLSHKPLDIFAPQTTIRQMMVLIWASDIYIGFDTGPPISRPPWGYRPRSCGIACSNRFWKSIKRPATPLRPWDDGAIPISKT
ncbi:MAG: hypothetical protein KZQ88_18425 [Candidatus Thiodiazotropha sp. (ex Dulcina madagascariensis)]|nr:hypothetical protein [Candidatus Thiodiazotropha sp. (ex Dulcina madagascariensis)]MCU7926607.1 hypothetical protein [Candidatus Thiodiazotropha sp. (ex Dulcina madagascariensis)]